MRKKIFLLFLLGCSLFAAVTVKPAYQIDVEGNVVDMVVRGDKLFVGTDAGKMEVYDWRNKKKTFEIRFDKIHDFMGDPIAPKVFCVDEDPGTGKILMLVQDEGGEKILYIYQNGKRSVILDKKAHLAMRETRFVDSDHILVSTISNELIFYDYVNGKIVWRKQLSESSFSDYQLNEDHSKVASTCESGAVYVTDIQSGKVLKHFENVNKDNVFHVDFKNYHILACGKDKKAVLYSLGPTPPVIYETKFMVYAGALNKNASMSAFQVDENIDIGIFDNETKAMRYLLKGQQSVLNNIVFVNDKELISSSDDNHIMIWRLP
ncbi:PQQ-binding-like beta-propeller repeat protein [Hydrogenimonas sp. SS33]|uniref:outer membrane protein assembly factor BamB family protein n=1 Tax=Hydrogenimonas leucolamina TaxID=2954236 RepID=UPI00336BB7C3